MIYISRVAVSVVGCGGVADSIIARKVGEADMDGLAMPNSTYTKMPISTRKVTTQKINALFIADSPTCTADQAMRLYSSGPIDAGRRDGEKSVHSF